MDLSEHVNRLERENRHLILKGESDDRMITMLKQDNENLRNDIERMIRESGSREDALRRERDKALSAATEIEGMLTQTANFLVQGLRARTGNMTPATIPDRPLRVVADDNRLPPNNVIG